MGADRDDGRLLQPGDVIGILGGGQLGRMLALAAARLGFDVHIFTPEQKAPASRVAAASTIAAYDDLDAVRAFARRCDVITYEFENVPAATALAASEVAPLRPGARALDVAQDRLTEKRFLKEVGARTVSFCPVDGPQDMTDAAFVVLAGGAILKTRRMGYDGKGQARYAPGDDPAAAFAAIGEQPAILEALAPFRRELSIVAARSLNGDVAAFPLSENTHSDGILRTSLAPAQTDADTVEEAARIARSILESLDYVGVLAVELFQLEDGALLVNEIAPRVHNTGHWTMDACACCQFEQHVRAVAGWALGPSQAHSAAQMTNLIGEDVHRWRDWLARPGAVLHLYGKDEARPGRKMGHVNQLSALEG
ncbi:MAG: 5-(carboxyamino)imidazole ribonucleotide synthase [Pseudomonadota bacterium]